MFLQYSNNLWLNFLQHPFEPEVRGVYAVDGRLVVVSQLHAGIDEPDVFVRFEDFLHPFPGSFPLSVFESPFFQVEVSAFAHLRLEEDQRRRGMAFADAPDEPFQPLVDLLGRRVRKGVEQKGVGSGAASNSAPSSVPISRAAISSCSGR